MSAIMESYAQTTRGRGMATASQVVRNELERIFEAESEAQKLNTEELVRFTRIREFGKWALLGDNSGLDFKRQIKFQARNKDELTEWQVLPVVTDDEGLAMDRILCRLTLTDRTIILKLYKYGISTREAARQLRMDQTGLRIKRDQALAFIAGHLSK